MMLNTCIRLSTVLIVLQVCGCCCLGIPSVRYEDSYHNEPSNWDLSSQSPDIACDSCHCTGCDGECQPHLFGPIQQEWSGIGSGGGPRNRPLRNWMQARLRAKQQPEWPRFHPLPTKPAFSPCAPSGDEQQLTYGRFGKIESTPVNDHASSMQPAVANQIGPDDRP